MKNLKIIENENGKTAVLCSQLYKVLGLDETHFNRWLNKNIINNPFAVENEDYTFLSYPNGKIRNKQNSLIRLKEEISKGHDPLTRPKGEIRKRNRQRTKDFVLSLDFAKHLAMMCRTVQGHFVRVYFIEYEKIHKAKENEIIEILKKRLSTYERLEQIRLIRIELNREVRELKTVLASTPMLNPVTNQLTLNFE
jgi:phage anti-repressor protein